ncbi:miniconductance mechanosensitive channel [Anaerotaenia torta]|uniref:mechanosensitive ion channel family protein n=1 Tax=Anaerotaenia torta TaxID=433293 RepID=UPI003D1C4156
MAAQITALLSEHGLSETMAAHIAIAVMIIIILLAAVLTYLLSKTLILRFLKVVVSKSKTKWDDILFQHKVFECMIFIIPALVVYAAAPLSMSAQEWLRRIAFCLMTFTVLLTFDRFLNAVNDIYRKFEASKMKPIKGYLQVLKIAAYIIGIIIIISTLMDRSPMLLLGGIGAATAVLLLVFQNTILGFVASIQLTENDMVRLGDWIEMPKYGADGDVTEITLHTVKVQNWDKTISTIPTHLMVSESFKNWRSMQETGGRRIKRAINIDITSIKFCNEEMLDRYKKIQYIQEYIENKTNDILEYNKIHSIDSSSVVNGRHLTNIGTLRAYINAYLQNHPGVHQSMTRVVRQLAPSEHGLPLEIYVFANTTKWNDYENIQADIFDHIFSIIPEFDLRIFQSPTGYDLTRVYAANTPEYHGNNNNLMETEM